MVPRVELDEHGKVTKLVGTKKQTDECWVIFTRRREEGTKQNDKYITEPNSQKVLRSLVEVKRFLDGDRTVGKHRRGAKRERQMKEENPTRKSARIAGKGDLGEEGKMKEEPSDYMYDSSDDEESDDNDEEEEEERPTKAAPQRLSGVDREKRRLAY